MAKQVAVKRTKQMYHNLDYDQKFAGGQIAEEPTVEGDYKQSLNAILEKKLADS